MVVEFCSNGTVETYYGKFPMDIPTVLRFAVDVCKGMVHLSAAGVIHRDLASRNLLVRKNKKKKK